MAGAGQKRIAKELAELTTSPPEGMTITLPSESDMYTWHITLSGPASTPYHSGTFQLLLTLPREYPFKPPKLSFRTKIYHPNISNDDTGAMCLGMLKGDQWKPSSKIGAVLESARQLLVEPNPDDAVEGNVAEVWKRDREGFEREAREWTRRYAGGK